MPGIPLEDAYALLLVGGLGTRLRSALPTVPKPLAPIGNLSFLELLVQQLRHQQIRRIVMCTGYLADKIEDKFGDGHDWGVTIQYSKETCPLGTAGAVKLAQSCVGEALDFLVLNGDSFLEVDFRQLFDFHAQRGGIASMAVRHVDDVSRYGSVQVNAEKRVVGFVEKAGSHGKGLINAGVYVFRPAVFEHIPEGPASLERDVFPRLLNQGIYALEQQGMFIDIGTPEDYAHAKNIRDRLHQAALSGSVRPAEHNE